MNLKLFILVIIVPSLAHTMEKYCFINGEKVDQELFLASVATQLRDLKGACTENNVHTIKDLGTKIVFKKRNRTLENWIKRVQTGKSPFFGKTPLFEYLYSEKELIPTGDIDTISFTQTESLHNGAWLYISNVRKYYIDQKNYIRMGAFLRIIDDIAVKKEQAVFASSSTTPCALGINKTNLLRDYYEKSGSSSSRFQKKDPIKRHKTHRRQPSSVKPLFSPDSGMSIC